jgi:hypothetical protein
MTPGIFLFHAWVVKNRQGKSGFSYSTHSQDRNPSWLLHESAYDLFQLGLSAMEYLWRGRQ